MMNCAVCKINAAELRLATRAYLDELDNAELIGDRDPHQFICDKCFAKIRHRVAARNDTREE